jgi:hypothetical protein
MICRTLLFNCRKQKHSAARLKLASEEQFSLPRAATLQLNDIAKLGLSGTTHGLGLSDLPASRFCRNLKDDANIHQSIYDFE